jgi:dehydrogenase/reductase SDR family member 1
VPRPTALVTGASRGVGRGVATALAGEGFHVFATGRTVDTAILADEVVRIRCDHTSEKETAAAFARIADEAGRLDLLVNCAWGGAERVFEDGRFTWMVPFWEQPSHRWTSMMDAGVRAAFVASSHAARLMVPQRQGLIVNIGYWRRKNIWATRSTAWPRRLNVAASNAYSCIPSGPRVNRR